MYKKGPPCCHPDPPCCHPDPPASSGRGGIDVVYKKGPPCCHPDPPASSGRGGIDVVCKEGGGICHVGRTGGGVMYPTQSEHILINTRVDRSLEIYLDDRTYQVEERGDEALSDRRTTRQRHPPCDTSQPARSSCS